jgi:hypothetical protein
MLFVSLLLTFPSPVSYFMPSLASASHMLLSMMDVDVDVGRERGGYELGSARTKLLVDTH